MNASEDLFSKSSLYIHRGLKLWDSAYNEALKRDTQVFLNEYEQKGRDPSQINLTRVKDQIDPLYRDKVDLYLINSSGIIEYSTEKKEYLLDFKKWPDFYNRIIEIMQGDAFVPDEIVKGFLPGSPLRKFVYQPTSDHRYLAQISLNVQNESLPERAALSYGDLVSYVITQNPELKDLHVISSMYTIVIGNKEYKNRKLDPVSFNYTQRVFETRERIIVDDPINQTVTAYVFVPNAEQNTPSSGYMNLVGKFIYSSADLDLKLINNLFLHLFLGISASLIAILIAGLISNRLTSPINQLVWEIDLIANGNYDLEIIPAKHPELCRITDAVKRMMSQINTVIRDLKISEERYHDLFTSASDGLLILEGDTILDANPVAISFFSGLKGSIVGKSLLSVCPSAYNFLMNSYKFRSISPVIPNFSSEILECETVCEADIRTGPEDNGGRILNIRIVPLNQGDIPILQMQIRDITHKVEMEQKLQNMNVDLEQQVKERTAILEATITDLDSFTYTVSHDLRAPLRTIDGNAHFLKEKGSTEISADMKYHISKIHEGIRLMDHLIDDLLKFSRMSRKSLDKEIIDMNLMVKEVTNEICSSIQNFSYQLEILDLPPAKGDPGLIRQVLINLISNAFKFGKPGIINHVIISAKNIDGRIWYEIKDTGIGFDMQYADKIFEVFLQLNPHGSYDGTGVGLAIVKRILLRHGGIIRVYSEEGVGSLFSFTIE